MRLPSIGLALLLASLPAAAQTNTSPSGSSASQSSLGPVIVHLQNQMAAAALRYASACPVGFSVDRIPHGAVVWTDSAPQPHGPGLDILFGKPTSLAPSQARIVSASIAVHGMSPHPRVMPLDSSAAPAGDVTETFSLGGNAGQPLLNPSVWTKNIGAVSSVELTQLVYADGTTWQPPAPRQCIARPSLYVPVAASR